MLFLMVSWLTAGGIRSCPETDFQCRNDGSCISSIFKCDGHNNCADGSDELSCIPGECVSVDFFAYSFFAATLVIILMWLVGKIVHEVRWLFIVKFEE